MIVQEVDCTTPFDSICLEEDNGQRTIPRLPITRSLRSNTRVGGFLEFLVTSSLYCHGTSNNGDQKEPNTVLIMNDG